MGSTSHIYEVEVTSDYKNILGHKQKLLKGYGINRKFRESVYRQKTKLLKLNVQPAKIGFEDIFKVLVVTDLIIEIIRFIFGNTYIPLKIDHNIGNYHPDSLSKILTSYYERITRRSFLSFIEDLSVDLRHNFASSLPAYPHSDCFINNICPNCSKLGFDRLDNTHHCNRCGFTMKVSGGVLNLDFIN